MSSAATTHVGSGEPYLPHFLPDDFQSPTKRHLRPDQGHVFHEPPPTLDRDAQSPQPVLWAAIRATIQRRDSVKIFRLRDLHNQHNS